MRIGFAVIMALVSFSVSAHNFSVLPDDEYRRAISQCSRPSPNATGSWPIGLKEIEAVEKDIHKLNEFSKTGRRRYSEYFKQYVGVVVDDKEYIYINAVRIKNNTWLLPIAIIYCDGGSSFFGALYDPISGVFSEFELNGF